ncbi:hypothetical protein HYZ78_03640 [Candidatus Microgenomates bacterium]|nr:hypothetical protein [Candidatus Microgenomates bacterium]
MKLPNSESAYVSREKLTNYLLSEEHPVGSSKAKFFRGLGFSEKNITELTRSLLKIAKSGEVEEIRRFPYGINYAIDGKITTPVGDEVKIKTVWFIKTGQTIPSFITAYPV